jgi:hypothetical protein
MNEIHTRDSTQVRRGLVVDPEAKHYRRMRQAIWLYLYLLLAAPPGSGRRLLDPGAVAQAMGLGETTVRSWLGHLRAGRYLSTEREGRRIWVQLTKWRPESKAGSGNDDSGQTGDATSLVAERLARKLGEPSQGPSLAGILDGHAPDQVQHALDRALAVPESQIRKSRLALFRYFLKQTK